MKTFKQKDKVPMTAIQGFLGSGKTTLLNYILKNNNNLNIGVVVNDFGDINIDSKLVKSKSDKKLELSSGCICCSLQTLDLQEALQQLVYEGSNIDYIIIEASGLAEPRDLATTLRHTLAQRVVLDSIVTVIDANNIEKNSDQHTLARDQIIFSDFIVINKIDLVKSDKLKDINKMILAFNPKARIFETKNAELDVRLLLGQNISKNDISLSEDHNHSHLHEQYDSFSWQTDKALDPMLFQQFANRCIDNNIYRAKGIINFGLKGGNRKYIYQLVGVRSDIYWQNWHKDKAETNLVFIGKEIDKKFLEKQLIECIDKQPSKPLPEGIELKLPAQID